MKVSIKKGLGFGLTSGIITTLGLMIGLAASTNSKLAVVGGIIVIAIADSLSDSLGMHISEEFSNKNHKEVWEATISTFFFKFIFAMSFIVPLLMFNLDMAVIVSIVWGLFLISIFSFYVSRENHHSTKKAVFEHILIAVLVIITTHYIGKFVGIYFG